MKKKDCGMKKISNILFCSIRKKIWLIPTTFLRHLVYAKQFYNIVPRALSHLGLKQNLEILLPKLKRASVKHLVYWNILIKHQLSRCKATSSIQRLSSNGVQITCISYRINEHQENHIILTKEHWSSYNLLDDVHTRPLSTIKRHSTPSLNFHLSKCFKYMSSILL